VQRFFDAIGVAFALVRANFRAQLQYRISFLLGSFAHLLITCGELLALWFLLLRFPRIGGWNFVDLSVLYGIVNLAMTLGDALANGFDRLPLAIRQGTFDRILLRPQSLTLQIIAQDFTLRRVGRGCQGLFALGYGLLHSDVLVLGSPQKLALVALCILSGALIFLGLWIVQGAVSFFSVESLEAMNVLTYGSSELAQYPFPIYSRWLRAIFVSLAPLALTSYFPTVALLEKVDPLGTSRAFQWTAPLFGPVFLWATFAVWRLGVKRYTSTGS
jgi:ABC-2 type transport system permease protein